MYMRQITSILLLCLFLSLTLSACAEPSATIGEPTSEDITSDSLTSVTSEDISSDSLTSVTSDVVSGEDNTPDEQSKFTGISGISYRITKEVSESRTTEFAEILSYSGDKDIQIPAEIEGVPVTRLSASMEWNIKDFREGDRATITLPDTMERLGQKSLSGLAKYNLTELTLPDSITVIEQEAAFGLNSLESLVLPQNLIFLGEAAFRDCTALRQVTLPQIEGRSSKLRLMDYAFYGTDLQTIVFDEKTYTQNDVLTLGNKVQYSPYTFFSPDTFGWNFASLNTPFLVDDFLIFNPAWLLSSSETDWSGGEYSILDTSKDYSQENSLKVAYAYVGNSESITLPNNVRYMHPDFGTYTVGVKHLNLNQCPFVYANTFKTHPTLETVKGEKLICIYGYAFSGCSKLTSVSAPLLDQIHGHAFAHCENLDTILCGTPRIVHSTAYILTPKLVVTDNLRGDIQDLEDEPDYTGEYPFSDRWLETP